MADCQRCGGACCESITLDITAPSSDFQRFIELRSRPQLKTNGGIARNFECHCSMLKDGRCLIYATRPQMCSDFIPGGQHCIATVRARRSPDDALAILGDMEG